MSSHAPAALHGIVQGLHHVAIAVQNLDEARLAYEGALGLSASEPEYVPDQKVRVLVLYAGTQRIELVEPASPDSPITKFLETRGPGIHHVAWKVANCAAAIAQAKAKGLRMIDEAPRPGSHHTTIAFLHPKSTGGVLMELVQDPPNAAH
ncbi:MAG: methylmalonyl-CoA epimerase [Planctomycetota bacterium]|nr:methylmalonyl-CoA epimerase [Planctomycetota bacterium]